MVLAKWLFELSEKSKLYFYLHFVKLSLERKKFTLEVFKRFNFVRIFLKFGLQLILAAANSPNKTEID